MRHMTLVMMTNTYLPFVGGVSNSVRTFADSLRARGHRVVVVAPGYGQQRDGDSAERDIVRVPSTRVFTKGPFAVSLAVQSELVEQVRSIAPDLIHSHHPFLLGDTALRTAAALDVPLLFTYHTRYEHYTHYVRQNSTTMKRLAVEIATGYCNMVDCVIAPSESIRQLLVQRGVERPLAVIPTGVDTAHFAAGDGEGFRRRYAIRDDAFVVGHVGRLAREKNCRLMAEAVLRFVRENPDTLFVLVGKGDEREAIETAFREAGLPHHLLPLGVLQGQDLVDAYHAMNAFLFASRTETQGMVLAEAMAAGVPVVGLDAPGVREVVQDRENGCLVAQETPDALADGLAWIKQRLVEDTDELRSRCRTTAARFEREKSVDALEDLYLQWLRRHAEQASQPAALFPNLASRIEREWDIWSNRVAAIQALMKQENASSR